MSVVKVALIFALSIYFYDYSVGIEEEKTLVTLKLGKIRGSVVKTYSEKIFLAFRGIPYAKPPVGQLRFKPPEKLTDPWLQPLDGRNEGPVCIQYEPFSKQISGQEDCLVLNVYTNEIPNDSKKIDKKAVMVFIHGGAFNFGTGISLFYGPKKLLDHNVVLVTINYRLSVFGFLSTQDEASPGNYGLLDQVMALEWIQENIEAFGGDPNKVTIFGESAGGASVSYHLLSDLSTGLFKSAIVMSGSPLSFWAHDYEPIQRTKKFASLVNCLKPNSNEIVECLRQLSLDKITQSLPELGDKTIAPFRPVVDGYFLKDHPLTLYKSGQIVNRVPLILGNTKNEGVFFYGLIFENSTFDLSDHVLRKFVAYILEIDDDKFLGNDVNNLIKNRYFQSVNSRDFELVKKKLIQISSEGFIDAPLYYNLKFYLKFGMKPFVYSLQYFTDHSISKLFGISEAEPTHADDLYFLFDSQVLFSYDFTRQNDKQEKIFLELWVNFAKTSNPTPEDYEIPIKWLPANDHDINVCYLDDPITLNKLQIDDKMIDFWMKSLFEMKLSNTKKDEL